MSRWKTNKCVPEFANLDWTPELRKAARRNGVGLYLDEKGRLPRFQSSYAHGAKNVRFGILASWAQNGQFFICKDTVTPEMVERFFGQVENWRPLPDGANTLQHDDLGDVVARVTDPLLSKWTPKAVVKDAPGWSPFRTQLDERAWQHEGRYVRW